jgi:type IV pilus assembly protein PilF
MKKYWLIALSVLLMHVAFADDELSPAEQRAATRTSLASEYYKRKLYAVAIEEAKKALESVPNYAQAYNVLALSYMALQDETSAKSYFELAIKSAPTDPDINHNYGNYLCSKDNYKAGISRFDIALNNPLYASIEATQLAAGNCSLKAGNKTLARSYFERAVKQQPNSLQAKFQLSTLLLDAGELPDAKKYFIDVLRAMPKSPPELLWLGVRIERKIGNKESESRYANELRRNYPDSVEATKLLTGQYD